MNTKFIGGVLLIVGTSIGGGMLALPAVNAAVGFWPSSIFLFFCWALMTLGALFILEANLYLPRGKHMVSMAAATLGMPGLFIAWLSYLFLLYTLLSGYISGGSDVLGGIAQDMGFEVKEWQTSTLFTILFGFIVYTGIRQVDFLNRFLMFGKLAVYCLLVLLIGPYVHISALDGGSVKFISGSIMILITSFGFAIIVPNLREYFDDDLISLRKVIFIGSLIPLICYIIWQGLIIGSLPVHGKDGISSLAVSDHVTSDLANLLSITVKNKIISSLFNFFTSICMLTAFLGVALCLISFLADGLKAEQKGRQGLMLFLLTFIPPLLIVIYYPGAYIYALNYAGIFCVILLLLLPALMTVYGRRKFPQRYRVPGGYYSQCLVISSSVILLCHAIRQIYLTVY